MFDTFMAGVTAVVVAMMAGLIGYVMAHDEIATECRRQGGFYVGSTDYECRVKERR